MQKYVQNDHIAINFAIICIANKQILMTIFEYEKIELQKNLSNMHCVYHNDYTSKGINQLSCLASCSIFCFCSLL